MHAKELKTFCLYRVITIVLLLLVTSTEVSGKPTQPPKDTVVSEGRTALFSCCSDIQKLFFWERYSTVSHTTAEINDISGLINGFRKSGRFNVARDSSPGCYSLIITDVRLEDAGTYKCIENAGLGQSIQWGLAVLESFECKEKNRKDEYMGVNNFGLLQDAITISCISKYIGNTAPKTVCEWSSGTQLYDNYQRFTETISTLTLDIQMPATKEMNNDQLYCYAKIEMEASDNQNPTTWKSTQFIINYASFQQKGISQCSIDELSLDCHPQCKLQLKRFSNGSQYCEITYPSQTHRKLDVLLQSNMIVTDLQGTIFIPSSTNKPVRIQVTPSGTTSFMWGVVITLLCVSGFCVGVYFGYRRTNDGTSALLPSALLEEKSTPGP